jgi:hypothetical protein
MQNRDLLDPGIKDDVANISLSNLLFKRKNFEQALELLAKVKTKKTELLINVKMLLLKIYYELDMFIEADMVLDTLRHLIPKAEKFYFSPQVYQSKKNFIKYYTTLIKAHEKQQQGKKTEILNDVKKEFIIEERSWFLDKINEQELKYLNQKTIIKSYQTR